MLELVGLASGALFSYAAVPSAFRTIKHGHSLGTPLDLSLCVFSGIALMATYLFLKNGFDWVLALGYGVEMLSWFVLIAYDIKERLES